MTAFVVRHVVGDTPTTTEHASFMERLKNFNRAGIFELSTINKFDDPDYLPPDCNGNLLRDNASDDLLYVDFNQFLPNQKKTLEYLAEQGIPKLHFGGSSKLLRGGKKYLYQSIPVLSDRAKRDTYVRWKHYKSQLAKLGVSVEGRIVCDVCCNSGMILANALSDGASWGVGWDLPEVTVHSQKIIAALGASRSSILPAQLSSDFKISETVPCWLRPKIQGAVLFYLAAFESVGLIEDLKYIPWKTLVYEGHATDTDDSIRDRIINIQSIWNCSLVSRSAIGDGDCDDRPLLLFQRP